MQLSVHLVPVMRTFNGSVRALYPKMKNRQVITFTEEPTCQTAKHKRSVYLLCGLVSLIVSQGEDKLFVAIRGKEALT
jgi:hypothetical protein